MKSEKSNACFGVLVNHQGEVVDAGPARSTSEGILVETSKAGGIQETIDLSNLVRVISINIYVTAGPSSTRCCWVPNGYGGWKCVPC
jgi:hypothetical protein